MKLRTVAMGLAVGALALTGCGRRAAPVAAGRRS